MKPHLKNGGIQVNLKMSEEEMGRRAAGSNVLIFGGTKGIGRAAGESLARRGAKVTVFGRSFQPSRKADLTFIKSDLSLMKGVSSLLDEQAEALKTADDILLTVGIFSGPTREETPERMEMDMAVSHLSRLLIVRRLEELKGRDMVKHNLRVWVWGFPGVENTADPEDLNAEKVYKQFPQHMATVVCNEAMIHAPKDASVAIRVIGINPGLIRTGIRENAAGSCGKCCLGCLVEPCIGLWNVSAAKYGEWTAMAVLAPELDGKTGLLFDQKYREIERNPWLTGDKVGALMCSSNQLLDKALL